MRRFIPLLLVTALTVAAAGCGDDGSVLADPDDPAATTATSAAPPPTDTTAPPPPETTTTTMPPTTTAGPTTTTTEPPTTTTTVPPTTTTTMAPTTTAGTVYEVDESSFFPDPLPGSDQAHGSGCTPGPDPTLPNGIWFGYVEGFSPGVVTFDLACFWTGAVAEAKALEDGEEAFDFYIRNVNPTTRQVPIAGSARVWILDATSGDLFPTEVPVTSWPHPDSYLMCPVDWCPVWLYVNGGEITGLVEQYLP